MFDLPHKDGRQATETSMPPSLVLVEQQDAVRTLVLNRPDALNSFNAQLHEQLLSALEQAAGDASVRCVVLTGAGRGFCAGQDLSDPEAAPDQNLGDLIERRYQPLCLRLKSMPVPVVAAVNGVAAGAGANIALACDLVIAAHNSHFNFACLPTGNASCQLGSSWHLPRLVGLHAALEIALLSGSFNAQQALAMGLVNRVVPFHQLECESHCMAERLCRAAFPSFGQLKQLMRRSFGRSLEQQLSEEKQTLTQCLNAPEYRENVLNHSEKHSHLFNT